MLEKEFITASPEETEAAGREIASALASRPRPTFVALYGDLGVGKTAFVRGFASVFAPDIAVRSPTFALVNEYRGRPYSVYHFDMYRITDEDELYSIGFYDYLESGICITEWTENIEYALPDQYLKITIEKTDLARENERRIRVEEVQ